MLVELAVGATAGGGLSLAAGEVLNSKGACGLAVNDGQLHSCFMAGSVELSPNGLTVKRRRTVDQDRRRTVDHPLGCDDAAPSLEARSAA
jgi:hypothetical protein